MSLPLLARGMCRVVLPMSIRRCHLVVFALEPEIPPLLLPHRADCCFPAQLRRLHESSDTGMALLLRIARARVHLLPSKCRSAHIVPSDGCHRDPHLCECVALWFAASWACLCANVGVVDFVHWLHLRMVILVAAVGWLAVEYRRALLEHVGCPRRPSQSQVHTLAACRRDSRPLAHRLPGLVAASAICFASPHR